MNASLHRFFLRFPLLACTLAGLPLLAGCNATTEQLQSRAAFDFQCDRSQLSIVQIDDQTRGVRGCGHQATYVERCNAPMGAMIRECTWVMNNTASRAE
jgi:hypothetical protein